MTASVAATLASDPRVHVDTYLVVPSCADRLGEANLHLFTLAVTDGRSWGWSIRRGHASCEFVMDRDGEFVVESRGAEENKARRWPLEEALEIALSHVDTRRVLGMTAEQFADHHGL